MATPYLRVNGIEILPYLADGGFKYEENDLDSEDSGRTLDGVMHRGRVGMKDKYTLTCKSLNVSECQVVLQTIAYREFCTVSTNIHPKYGTSTKIMYNSSRTAAVFSVDDDGNVMWDNISFTLIEQ